MIDEQVEVKRAWRTWLQPAMATESGLACMYVCGDAKAAKDVQTTLIGLIDQDGGKKTGLDMMRTWIKEGRYFSSAMFWALKTTRLNHHAVMMRALIKHDGWTFFAALRKF